MSQQQSDKEHPFTNDHFHRRNEERAQAIAAAKARGHVPCECPNGMHKDDCLNAGRGTGTTLSQRSFGGPDYEDDLDIRQGQQSEFTRRSE